MVVVVMGVSGCGKTTIASSLAQSLGWAFIEGDVFHPPENVQRMAHGIALTDADRALWLERLALELKDQSRINAALRMEVDRNLNGRRKTTSRKHITP